MQYPLTLSFKILAVAPQIFVKDAAGNSLFYVHQKLFKLKEQIRVYRDSSKEVELFQINADRVIDFSARYSFTGPDDQALGSIKRKGARSLWKATYEIEDRDGRPLYTIEEESAWVKLLDGLLGEIPVLGAFTGYFLNPTYLVQSAGKPVFKVVKHRSFLESTFEIQAEGDAPSGADEAVAVLGVLMMVLLERSRG